MVTVTNFSKVVAAILVLACGSAMAQDKLAAWIIHGRQEMVKQNGPDDSVDSFHAESLRELAQGKHCRGQIFDRPIADGE